MTGSGNGAIDTSKPHSARMYDYYLGGKDWFPIDQEAAEQVKKVFPVAETGAHANRGFMHRATRALTTQYGIRQFVDIGTGIPTEPNLHQIAQEAAPESRVVYADHDPLVLEYADALMHSTPEGRTAYIQADVRHDAILDDPELRRLIDLEKPVALSLNALLHFVPDENEPYGIVGGFLDQLAPGSFLMLSHATADFDDEAGLEKVREIYRGGGTPLQLRSKAEIERFFDGLELLEPGLTPTHRWRNTEGSALTDKDAFFYAGLARKP